MRILIVCSGNVENFSLEKHHAFIFDQVNSVKIQYPDTEFDYFLIKGKGLVGYLSNLKRFRQKIRDEKFDLIHAHYALSSLLANLQLRVPVVTTFHGSDINLRHLNILSSTSSLLSRQSIFVSNKLRDKILFKSNKNRINIIPCGIDLSEFYPVDRNTARNHFKLSSDKKYVLFSSSFTNKVKNYPLAEKAVELLNDNSVELLELKNYNRQEVNLLLNAVDAALMTSFSEGSPQFIKEAMAVNCPVVSTAVGDVSEVITGIEGCYITEYSPEEVAEKLGRALKINRTEGRERIVHFDSNKTARKVYNVYLKATKHDLKVNQGRRCTLGIWDESVPGIQFDETGVSNYARIQQHLMKDHPIDKNGLEAWRKLVEKIKKNGNRSYDCIMGVSGGTDSSYLLHIAKQYGLRPLAVNLDNGWNSDIAVKNIKKVTSALDIDLETYVIDYEEIKDLLRGFMRAGLPWIDAPTDLAIQSVLYKYAKRERIKYILIGSDFFSEGKQPTEWTYADQWLMRHIHRKFCEIRLKTYPTLSFTSLIYLGYLSGIKMISPYNYIEYNKESARDFLIKKYGWEYYGEHHHENLFTKWAIGYWMYEKFGIDKRLITYSAQILNNKMSRDEAIKIISVPPYKSQVIKQETEFVLKKLGITQAEFEKIWGSQNRSFKDYPSWYPFIKRFARIIAPVLKYIVSDRPKIFYEMEGRVEEKK